MLESDGHREELTGFERAHLYGVKILERGRNGLVFSFRAVSSLRVSVKAMGNKWRAFLEILGEPREVRKMFLQVSGGLFPTLEWLEVTDEGGRKFRYFPDSTEWREQP